MSDMYIDQRGIVVQLVDICNDSDLEAINRIENRSISVICRRCIYNDRNDICYADKYAPLTGSNVVPCGGLGYFIEVKP